MKTDKMNVGIEMITLDDLGLVSYAYDEETLKKINWDKNLIYCDEKSYNTNEELEKDIKSILRVIAWGEIEKDRIGEDGGTSKIDVAVRITKEVDGKEVQEYSVYPVSLIIKTFYEILPKKKINK